MKVKAFLLIMLMFLMFSCVSIPTTPTAKIWVSSENIVCHPDGHEIKKHGYVGKGYVGFIIPF